MKSTSKIETRSSEIIKNREIFQKQQLTRKISRINDYNHIKILLNKYDKYTTSKRFDNTYLSELFPEKDIIQSHSPPPSPSIATNTATNTDTKT